jgi:hypothetical protein
MPEQVETTVIASDAPPRTKPLSWDQVCQSFGAERSYWLATAGPGGHPQMRPVLAVCLADRIYSTTSPRARKGAPPRASCGVLARCVRHGDRHRDRGVYLLGR